MDPEGCVQLGGSQGASASGAGAGGGLAGSAEEAVCRG